MATKYTSTGLCLILLGLLYVPENIVLADNCVDCHKNSKFRIQHTKLFEYYEKWNGSKHQSAGVTCVDCHGGDIEAVKLEDAHPAHLSTNDPASNTYYKNLPQTCGHCHQEIVSYFNYSEHSKKLQAGVGPHCVSCHDSMNTSIPRHRVVELICMGCHSDSSSSHVVNDAKSALNRLNSARGYLGWFSPNKSNPEKDIDGKREQYQQRYHLIAAGWHRFNLDMTLEESKDLLSDMYESYMEITESE